MTCMQEAVASAWIAQTSHPWLVPLLLPVLLLLLLLWRARRGRHGYYYLFVEFDRASRGVE